MRIEKDSWACPMINPPEMLNQSEAGVSFDLNGKSIGGLDLKAQAYIPSRTPSSQK